MSNSINPYSPPKAKAPLASSLRQGINPFSLALTIFAVVIGGAFTAISLYYIYVNDPRIGTHAAPSLDVTVIGGGIISAVIWAISGWFQRSGIKGLGLTFLASALLVTLWIICFGTYEDVLATACCLGWSVTGLITSLYMYLSKKSKYQKNNLKNGLASS